jgi:DNA-binding response OmpR family regulator
MKTLLVLAPHPEFAEAIRAALPEDHYRVLHCLGLEEAEPLLGAGRLDACLMDVELAQVQAIWAIEKLRRRIPKCPLLVFTGAEAWEWEEEAYLQGAAHVLRKPARARMLTAVLERLWTPSQIQAAPPHFAEIRTVRPRETGAPPSAGEPFRPHHPLEVLRDFSAVLTHSLHADALLRQFLLHLRGILAVNRAAVFLRQPVGSSGAVISGEETRSLRSACAIGLSHGLLEHFELSFETGIGGFLFRQGRILRRESDEAQADLEVQREFELLGAQVAVPILDRETLIGIAAFDGRVTGEALSNPELELIFHLLEELGLAIRNIWLHDQLAANHEMMADILRV